MHALGQVYGGSFRLRYSPTCPTIPAQLIPAQLCFSLMVMKKCIVRICNELFIAEATGVWGGLRLKIVRWLKEALGRIDAVDELCVTLHLQFSASFIHW